MTFHEAITKYDKVRLHWWLDGDYISVEHYGDEEPYLDYQHDFYDDEELIQDMLTNYFTDDWEEYKE